MFTPDQAELTMKLSKEPESVSDIAGRTSMEEAPLAEKLEKFKQEMARQVEKKAKKIESL